MAYLAEIKVVNLPSHSSLPIEARCAANHSHTTDARHGTPHALSADIGDLADTVHVQYAACSCNPGPITISRLPALPPTEPALQASYVTTFPFL